MLRRPATEVPPSSASPSTHETASGSRRLTAPAHPKNALCPRRVPRGMGPSMASSQWLAATIVLALAATPVPAQLTKEERACQQAAAKQCPTFLGKKIKCLVGCDKQA